MYRYKRGAFHYTFISIGTLPMIIAQRTALTLNLLHINVVAKVYNGSTPTQMKHVLYVGGV